MTLADRLWRYLAATALPLLALVALFGGGPRRRYPPRPLPPFTWHRCGCAGCRVLVRPAQIMCLRHWCRLPVPMRVAVLEAFRAGELVQSQAWHTAARRAIDLVSDGRAAG